MRRGVGISGLQAGEEVKVYRIHPTRLFGTFSRFIIEQSDSEFYSATPGMALVGLADLRPTRPTSPMAKAAPCRGIGTADALFAYLACTLWVR